jgi:uncharacterized glyoxalase superfamily metalloenzyme YdcJ
MSAHINFTETWRLRAGFAAALSRMYGAEVPAAPDQSDYSLDWMAGAIGHHVHDPYDLYEKATS